MSDDSIVQDWREVSRHVVQSLGAWGARMDDTNRRLSEIREDQKEATKERAALGRAIVELQKHTDKSIGDLRDEGRQMREQMVERLHALETNHRARSALYKSQSDIGHEIDKGQKNKEIVIKMALPFAGIAGGLGALVKVLWDVLSKANGGP